MTNEMVVVYYQRPDGSIRMCHQVPDNRVATIDDAVEQYNASQYRDKAVVVRLEEGGFLRYLWEKNQNEMRGTITDLRDLQRELSSAEYMIEDIIACMRGENR